MWDVEIKQLLNLLIKVAQVMFIFHMIRIQYHSSDGNKQGITHHR